MMYIMSFLFTFSFVLALVATGPIDQGMSSKMDYSQPFSQWGQ